MLEKTSIKQDFVASLHASHTQLFIFIGSFLGIAASILIIIQPTLFAQMVDNNQ